MTMVYLLYIQQYWLFLAIINCGFSEWPHDVMECELDIMEYELLPLTNFSSIAS